MFIASLRYRLNRLRGIRMERLGYCVRRCAQRSGRSRIAVFADMCACYALYGAVYTDYLLFGFDALSLRQKGTYMTRSRFRKLALWANPPSACALLGSKYAFYQRYHEYMARRMVRTDASDEALDCFLAANSRFFLKPDGGTGGEGVSEFLPQAYPTAEAMKRELRSKKDCVLEEPIVQHPLMSRFNADSVNTLRIVYLSADEETHFLYCSLRIGRKGSRVDNLCAGGMICAVDTRRGCVCSDAFDNDGNAYPAHPDDGDTVFRGMPVPRLPEALALSRTVAERLYRETGLRLVGFDIAVTPEAPVILEANAYPTHYGWQRPGFRDEGVPTGLWEKVRGIMKQGTAAS